ncbi:hypothetical protein M885DRAFT_509831 [Pelagophyceae sp. CCMP2097]|nr:hypothetical protein M885DRAFT_509831 [Pelagophyceae sp. CCMP2097]
MSCVVGRALAAELRQARGALASHALSVTSLLHGGVLRATPRSRFVAALQAEIRARPLLEYDGVTAADLDAGFGELRRCRDAVAQLDALEATHAHTARRRTPRIAYGVGQVVYHRVFKRCVVYGWEHSSENLTEHVPDHDLIDNRKHFAGIDADLVRDDTSRREPHFRCLFADGAARACSGANLVNPGYANLDIKGSSVFFKALDTPRRRLVPCDALELLYPDDADHAGAALTEGSSAAHALQFLESRRNLHRALGDDMYRAAFAKAPEDAAEAPD